MFDTAESERTLLPESLDESFNFFFSFFKCNVKYVIQFFDLLFALFIFEFAKLV